MGIGGLLTRGCQPVVVGCATADRIERWGATGDRGRWLLRNGLV
jgi:hypothetical protein